LSRWPEDDLGWINQGILHHCLRAYERHERFRGLRVTRVLPMSDHDQPSVQVLERYLRYKQLVRARDETDVGRLGEGVRPWGLVLVCGRAHTGLQLRRPGTGMAKLAESIDNHGHRHLRDSSTKERVRVLAEMPAILKYSEFTCQVFLMSMPLFNAANSPPLSHRI
jgi:hypothetical protein